MFIFYDELILFELKKEYRSINITILLNYGCPREKRFRLYLS